MASRDVTEWLASKPGPFAGRTCEEVWRAAYTNFLACGHSSGVRLDFIVKAQAAGLDVRPTGVGGFVLDTALALGERQAP